MSLSDTDQSALSVQSPASQLDRLAETLPDSVKASLCAFGIEMDLQRCVSGCNETYRHRCRISIHGSAQCSIEIEADSQACMDLYEGATGLSSSIPDELDESLAEFANQILGHAKTQVELPDSQLGLPQFFTAEQSNSRCKSPSHIYQFDGKGSIQIRFFPDLN
ncbi:MAG TPA: hypothetical protein DDW52_29290 [Planctomycetaceae bacterium]|nr:hypothetical protein [Planctomycetaceae bacterium]